mgnify:FL=1
MAIKASIDSVDDALHAVDVTVSGGEMTLATGDDGVHADNTLTVSGGTITVTRSYEGLEGTDVTLSGGEISITASDDGINGAGGDSATSSDEGTFGASGRFGRDRFASSTGTVRISGGVISVSASGDGVDVNGDLEMTGGELYVNGPESGGDGALDYDGSFTLTGGTDCICASCPHSLSHVCDAAGKVQRYDSAVLMFCGLSVGSVLRWSEFTDRVSRHILEPGLLQDICGDCQWYSICGSTK